MNDQTAPGGLTREEAQAVRDWAAHVKGVLVQDGILLHAARVLLEVLPKRPTLADMTAWELEKSRWMQCEVEEGEARAAIINPYTVRVLWPDGALTTELAKDVTPRPDLPRLTWPGELASDSCQLPDGWRLAKHQTRGPVIVTRPEPDNDGEVVVLCPDPHRVARAELVWCRRDKLTYTDTEPEEA